MSSPPKKKNGSDKAPVVIEGTAVEVEIDGTPRKAPPPPQPTLPPPVADDTEPVPQQIYAAADAESLLGKIKQSMQAARPAHRPSGYNEDVADDICAEIASGKLMKDVWQMDGMPSERTFFRWQNQYPEFCAKVSRALRTAIDNLPQHALAASRGQGDGLAKTEIEWARLQIQTDFEVQDRDARTLLERAAKGKGVPGDNAKLVEQTAEVVEHNPLAAAMLAWSERTGNALTQEVKPAADAKVTTP